MWIVYRSFFTYPCVSDKNSFVKFLILIIKTRSTGEILPIIARKHTKSCIKTNSHKCYWRRSTKKRYTNKKNHETLCLKNNHLRRQAIICVHAKFRVNFGCDIFLHQNDTRQKEFFSNKLPFRVLPNDNTRNQSLTHCASFSRGLREGAFTKSPPGPPPLEDFEEEPELTLDEWDLGETLRDSDRRAPGDSRERELDVDRLPGWYCGTW